MKYISEYRDSALVKILSEEITKVTKGNFNIMEICGGQTHSIMKYNLKEFLPESLNLLHGPGCPVCVTPQEKIDTAVNLAINENVILTSFGDMLRVPGSGIDLLSAKASGADVRTVYSPLESLKIAKENPKREVVFFAVGFETTAPANAMSVLEASVKNLKNFSIICSHVLVPPAIEFLLSDDSNRINAFLAAGHVCTVMGYDEYEPISDKYRVPIVVTGFEPVDILSGILAAVKQLEAHTYKVQNAYGRAVNKQGNPNAKKILNKVFRVSDMKWRGIGNIPGSGFTLNDEFESFDAEKKFHNKYSNSASNISCSDKIAKCIAGEILLGKKEPYECTLFSDGCNPENPVGAPMVSSEGACAAYHKFRNRTI